MAKNFPYFKFIVSEWMTGDIVYESFSVQGLFINICALYWQRDGILSVDDINKRYKNPDELKNLLNIFIHIENDFISINFLDEQLIEAGHISKINSDKGKKSALKRAEFKQQFNSGSTAVQPISTKKRRIRIKEEEKESKLLEQKNISLTHIEYEKLVNEFSETLTLAAIKFLSDYKIEKGYKTKNDNLTIRRWVIDAVKKNNVPVNQTQASKFDKIVETVNKAHEQIRKRHEANNG